MAWTQTDIDELKAAMGSGVLKVSFTGPPSREVEYRSLAEMQAILVMMQREVSGAAAPPRYKLATTRKGV